MTAIKPFTISVPDAAIENLRAKLSQTKLPHPTDFTNSWDYGVPLNDIARLISYWQQDFDWRAAEAKLNSSLPQFTTSVSVDNFGPIDIHFVHQPSSTPDSIPLLFCHGWPGSFLEVIKILPLLTQQSPSSDHKPTFHVVAPSLPNFGFSGRVTQPGFASLQYAEVCHKLMLRLGYDHYVTQGGDWGYIITRLMAAKYPAHVLASHLNFVRVLEPPKAFSTSPPSVSAASHPVEALKHTLLPYTEAERDGIAQTKWFREKGYGYNLLQATRPHTLGFALADSPVALLAWIYEKLHDWTDGYPWTDDEVLTWISIYAFSTAGPEASVRIYYEHEIANGRWTENKDKEGENDEVLNLVLADGYIPQVLVGLSYFPKDLIVPPSTWGRSLGPVVFEKRHGDGGHFAAYERPERLVEDLQSMFGKGGGAEGLVERLKTQARI